jgi:hypothetical protein
MREGEIVEYHYKKLLSSRFSSLLLYHFVS